MARDIEEFLRRAAERRQQQQRNAGNPAPDPAPQQPARPTKPIERRPIGARQPINEIEEIEVEIIEPTLVSRADRDNSMGSLSGRAAKKTDMRHESVSEHVSRHLDTSRISEQTQSLGKRIASVHDEIDRDVHRHLDHDISVVDDKPTITDDVRQSVVGEYKSPIAVELLQMLSNPKSIRQAIIMKEILTRPEFDD